ncbi:DNA cytosine methyltransferase [Salinivibrio kushneri]|uniref:DNA (cytosine-5-)-methyltransferase n=1 Tax=Salinivibrio kushneri TaxID=1908198 RepID=A0AB36K803_9GAMM|nr:DNA cytosine methyltransferase [Salinivibrio kushneri]OOE45103.1 DNA cytosine methyltransferase [Salinivibrio kushneri]
MIRDDELIVDSFAGGGGASVGIELATGRHVDIAINHDQDAIDMHTMNHPKTTHYCESVWEVDPIKACNGNPVGLAWFSPDCKHFSKAKGGTPVEQKIRGLAWVAILWAMRVPVRILMLENVKEFMTWGPLRKRDDGKGLEPDPAKKGATFNAFISALTTGLKPSECYHSWREAVCALGIQYDIQAKLKLYRGLGYDVKYHSAPAYEQGAPTTRERFYLVARNDGEPVYWPTPTHGMPSSLEVQAGKIKPWRTAAECIDWSIPTVSIFNRPRPLAEATMRRIAKGIQRFVVESDNPFIVPDHSAFITEHANASSQRNMPINEPLRTICAKVKGGHFALVASHLVKFRGTNYGSSLDAPMPTVSAGGNHIGEVRAFLIKYYGTNVGQPLNEPIQTITTKDRFGIVVTVHGEDYVIADIGMRMLQPHELFKGMDFPAGYQFTQKCNGKRRSKAEQVARCGNAVCPSYAQALVEANINKAQRKRVAAA